MSKVNYKEYEALYMRSRKMPDGEELNGMRILRFFIVYEPSLSEEELWEFAKEFEQKEFNVPDIHEELHSVKEYKG